MLVLSAVEQLAVGPLFGYSAVIKMNDIACPGKPVLMNVHFLLVALAFLRTIVWRVGYLGGAKNRS